MRCKANKTTQGARAGDGVTAGLEHGQRGRVDRAARRTPTQMIPLDANLLFYAYDTKSDKHAEADRELFNLTGC
jgi:hypothetical protein